MTRHKRATRSRYFQSSETAYQDDSSEDTGSTSAVPDMKEDMSPTDKERAEEEDEVKSSDDGGPVSFGKRKRTKQTTTKQGKKNKVKSSSDSSMEAASSRIPNTRLPIVEIDTAIHRNTMDFLRELAENNHRSWFYENDPIYRKAKQDFERFVTKLSERIIDSVDTTIPELPLKDLVFRIHRDIRFSNDQTPYKIYFSAAWSRTGRKGPYAHYYLQIQPHGKSMVGGGIWHCDAQQVSLLRRDISRDSSRIKRILTSPSFARDLLGLKGKISEDRAVESFAQKNAEDALKTAPKGYAKDHHDIQLLRLRSFTVGRAIGDDEITSPNALQLITTLFSTMEPLITYLNSVVMPDLTSGGSSDDNAS